MQAGHTMLQAYFVQSSYASVVSSTRHTVRIQESRVLGEKTKKNVVQVQQHEHHAWQAFCAASVRVVQSEAATAPMQEGRQGEQELYQHRLPQLAERMQRLLSEAGLTSQHAQSMLPMTKYGSCLLPVTVAVHAQIP